MSDDSGDDTNAAELAGLEELARANTIPTKSKKVYEQHFKQFEEWMVPIGLGLGLGFQLWSF
jgi:hypothetical protein